MVRQKIKEWFHEEWERLKPMSLRKKMEHIWYYYKWVILGFVLFLVILISGISNRQYQSRELLLSGIFINTSTSPEGYAYVKEDYWTFTGADPDTRVELTEARSIRFNVEQPTEMDVNLITSVDTMIATSELDYIIGDASAVEFYSNRDCLLDLSALLTPAQLENLTVVTGESGIVAIDLTESALHLQFGLSTEPSYLMILVNTTRQEQCAAFIQYLLTA